MNALRIVGTWFVALIGLSLVKALAYDLPGLASDDVTGGGMIGAVLGFWIGTMVFNPIMWLLAGAFTAWWTHDGVSDSHPGQEF